MRPMTDPALDDRPELATNGAPPDPARQRDAAVADLKDSLKDLLRSLLRATTGIALDPVEDLAVAFQPSVARGGLGLPGMAGGMLGGVLGGIRAGLSGRHPIWGALKGAVGALSPAARIGLLVALVLALLLLPVTVVLILVALIVLVIVAAVRASG